MDQSVLDKLKNIKGHMETDRQSCLRTVELYKGARRGETYTAQYSTSADFLKRYIDEIDEEFPELRKPREFDPKDP